MNRDTLEGNWLQLKGKIREKWGEMTDDDLNRLDGKREQLLGKLQERTGIARERLERDLDDIVANHR